MSLASVRRAGAAAVALAAFALAVPLAVPTPSAAQLGDPGGPGQAVAAPSPQCPHTVACSYAERNPLPPGAGGYRFQRLEVCGANCTSQYWVSDGADGRMLLTVEPLRGGGIVANGRAASGDDRYPPVRTIVPDYAPSDAMCCPSGFKDTTYTWDAARRALVAGPPTTIPSASFPGWDELRQRLEGDQFFDVFHGV